MAMLRVALVWSLAAALMMTDCEDDDRPRKVLFAEEALAYKKDSATCCRPSFPHVVHSVETGRAQDQFGHEVVHQAPAEGYVCQGEPVAKSPQPVATLEQCTTMAETHGVRYSAYSRNGACRVFRECGAVAPDRDTTVYVPQSGRHDLYWKAVVNGVTGRPEERCGRCADKPYLHYNRVDNKYCCSAEKPQDERWFDALYLIEYVLLPAVSSWAPEYEAKMRPRIDMLYEISMAIRRALTLPSQEGEDLPEDAGSKSPPFILSSLGLDNAAVDAQPEASGAGGLLSGLWGKVKQTPWQLGKWLETNLETPPGWPIMD
jgi:hypothetical protein